MTTPMPMVLPSGMCFNCNNDISSIKLGYNGRCEYCGTGNSYDLDVRRQLDDADQEVEELNRQVKDLERYLELKDEAIAELNESLEKAQAAVEAVRAAFVAAHAALDEVESV